MKFVAINPRFSAAALLVLLIAFFLTGCTGHRHPEREAFEELQAAKLPEFLVGPASALLTNLNSFSARVTVDQPGLTNKNASLLSGQLLVSASRLLFAPKSGDRAFIWDTRTRSGYVLSDALQGYAPISSPVRITNILITAEIAGPTETQVNGHPGHEAEVTLTSNDGSTAKFSVWRAKDLGGFPVRIKTMNTLPAFTLNLFDLRSENLLDKLFLPPDGFTKYASPEAMASELYSRKSKVRSAGSRPYMEAPSGGEYHK